MTDSEVSNFMNGQIYKIVCDSDPDWCYVGSTTQKLNRRWSMHKYGYRRWKKNPSTQVKISWFEHVGIRSLDEYHIICVEILHNISKKELENREGYWITELKACNRFIAGRPKIEYQYMFREKIRQRKKIYRENNKELIKQLAKTYRENNEKRLKEKEKYYRENNKEAIKQAGKKYRENNKEKVIQKNKKWRDENDSKRKEKYTCDCGGKYTHQHKATHEKTKRHLEYIKKQE